MGINLWRKAVYLAVQIIKLVWWSAVSQTTSIFFSFTQVPVLEVI